MLPGFRILFALVVLSFAMLIFGFSALALLRTAHQNLASQPTWQPAWRTPLEIANAQRNDRQPPSATQTLALLRVDPPATPPVSGIGSSSAGAEPPPTPPAPPTVQPAAGDSRSSNAERDAAASVKPQPLPVDATAPSAKAADCPIATESTEPVATTGDKPVVPAAAPLPVDDAPKPTASNANAELAATDTPSPPAVQAVAPASPPPAPATGVSSAKIEEPARELAKAEMPAPTAEMPTRLAALPDSTSSSEARANAALQTAKKPDAAEVRAKRRARLRLRARRLALARARAAQLAQAQQGATNSVFYNSAFPTTSSTTTGASAAPSASNATPIVTPFGPRTAP